jgi:hypothetical protein
VLLTLRFASGFAIFALPCYLSGDPGVHAGGAGGFVDGLQPADGDMGGNLGGFEFGVSEHGLDEADIGPVLEHEGGTGMAEDRTTACGL